MFKKIKSYSFNSKNSVLPRLTFLPVTFFPKRYILKQFTFEKLIKLSLKWYIIWLYLTFFCQSPFLDKILLDEKGFWTSHLGKRKFLKRIKDSERFADMLKELGVNRSTVSFKSNLLKLLEKYPQLKKSSLSLNFFFKNYFKSIKEVCKKVENFVIWG